MQPGSKLEQDLLPSTCRRPAVSQKVPLSLQRLRGKSQIPPVTPPVHLQASLKLHNWLIWIDRTWSEIVGFAFQKMNGLSQPAHLKKHASLPRCWAKVNLTNAETAEYLNFNRPSVVQEFLRYFPCSAYSSIELDCYCSSSPGDLGGGPGGNCT